jgi:DNA-binding transcriptional regulator LsrR (DeoR family)
MANERDSQKRSSLLADVAEKYYLDGMDQSAIAGEVGVTRSMVSRMLTEARNRGIVEIKVNRPIHLDHELEVELKARYPINSISVVSMDESRLDKLLVEMGRAAADVFNKYLIANSIVGVAWGTSISATVDAVQPQAGLSVDVVQLVGAQGAKNLEYDGHALVKRLAEKLGGEGYSINAPCICPTPEIAISIRETKGVKETIEMGHRVQIALLGVGTTETEYSSFYLSGLVASNELSEIRKNGGVGDIAGNYFCIDGSPYIDDFLSRMITINLGDLKKIPIRIGIAGGPGKVNAVTGALNSGLLTHLVTDSVTVNQILHK